MNRRLLTSYDRLVNANRLNVAQLVVKTFRAVELHPNKEEQLLALAGAFVLMSQVLRVKAQDAFTAVGNLMTKRDGTLVHQFDAMKYHLETEVTA